VVIPNIYPAGFILHTEKYTMLEATLFASLLRDYLAGTLAMADKERLFKMVCSGQYDQVLTGVYYEMIQEGDCCANTRLSEGTKAKLLELIIKRIKGTERLPLKYDKPPWWR
jgi:hypothetical protein